MDSGCDCCGKTFIKKNKGYQRTSIFVKGKKAESVANVLQRHFNVPVTPGRKDVFICNDCASTITCIPSKYEEHAKAEERLRKVRVAGSYISKKIGTPVQAGSSQKRKKPRFSTPKKAQISKKTSKQSIKCQAINDLSKSYYRRGFRKLFKKKKAKDAAVGVIGDLLRSEIKELIRNSKGIEYGLQDLLNFSWLDELHRVNTTCPSLVSLLLAALTTSKKFEKDMVKKRGSQKISVLPILGTILSIITYNRTPKLNLLQQLNSVMLWLGGTKRKVFHAFHKIGLCQGIKGTVAHVDRFRQAYDSKVLHWRDEISTFLQGNVDSSSQGSSLQALDDVWEDLGDDYEDEEGSSSETSDPTNQSEFSEVTTGTDPSESAQESSDETLKSDITEMSTDQSGIVPLYDVNSCYMFDITFDNVNQKIGVRHHVRGKANKMLNMVQGFAAKDRIPSENSFDEPSAEDIRNIPLHVYVPNAQEEDKLRSEVSVMVCRIICQHMKCFQDIIFDESIPHRYSRESAWKSEIVPLGIIRKDETKTAEMIDILDLYRQYVPADKKGDPIPMLLYCDGLSCERVDGAQRARINGGDKWEKLQMFEPSIQEWHRRLMYIQDTFDELFKLESHREKGTLYNIKQVFDHKGVSSNIMECFNKAEELLEFATQGYTLSAALHFMATSNLSETPKECPEHVNEKAIYVQSIADLIVDLIYQKPNTKEIMNVSLQHDDSLQSLVCICHQDLGGMMVYCSNNRCDRGQWFHLDCIGLDEADVPKGKWFCSELCEEMANMKRSSKKKNVASKLRDNKREYALKLLWRGLNNIARHDAVKENDGMRMISHWKFDLLEFFETNHPKYFIYGHKLITSVSGGVSKQLQHQLIWNRTVNINGGKRKNIPKDLFNEFLNKDYKENSRDAGGQLTDNTIARHSQMLGVGKALEKIFHGEVALKSTWLTRKHSTVERSSDVQKLVEMLKPLKLFDTVPGRAFKGFENLQPYRGVSLPKKFKERVMRLKERIAVKKELQDVL